MNALNVGKPSLQTQDYVKENIQEGDPKECKNCGKASDHLSIVNHKRFHKMVALG